jgi:predicted membrane-bound spermidine synthase
MNSQHRSRIAVLIALAFLSGCCALAYEVLYMRALTTLLGDMLHVHAALLSAFLVGIGLGAKLAHRWLRWLWAFEVVTGLYALGVPAAAKWFSGQSMMVAVTGSHALTIVTTAGFLLVPSVLIGFSIPLFSAYIKSEAKDHLAFQGVYAAYNLGAFLSILAVELFLVRQLGVRLSLALVGGVNLMNGAVLLLMKAAPEHAPDVPQRTFEPRVVFALALASVVSAVFQLFFLKLTYLVFAPHRENFAIGLSVTLLGIFLGARLAARVRIRFETCLVLVPVLIGAVYAGWVPLVYLHQATAPLVRGSELLILAHKFAFGCVFALGPMILFGAMLPALMRSEQEVAGESGHLLFVSSLANAAGYLIYVLLGHPLLETHALLVLLASATLLASLLGCGLRWTRMHWGVAAVGVGLVALLAGQWQDRNFYLAQWISILRPDQEVMTFKSGSESATLLREPQRELISYNGHSSISVRKGPFITLEEVISGVIPALSAPRLDRALVLGCGTGITAGTVSRIFRHTDVVEINAAFYEMMPYLSLVPDRQGRHLRRDRQRDPGAHLLLGVQDLHDRVLRAREECARVRRDLHHLARGAQHVGGGTPRDPVGAAQDLPLLRPAPDEPGLLHRHLRRPADPRAPLQRPAGAPEAARRAALRPALLRSRRGVLGHPALREHLRVLHAGRAAREHRRSPGARVHGGAKLPAHSRAAGAAQHRSGPARRIGGRRPALSQGRLLLPSRSVLLQAELRAADRARHHRRAAPLRAPLL